MIKHNVLTIVPRSPCAVSNVLDRIGDKWSLLIIRDIIFYEKHEYKDFLASPEGIATNILASRLKLLLEAQILSVIEHPANRSRKLYFLTPQGKDLVPLLAEVVLWADKHLPPSTLMKPVAKMLKKNRDVFIQQLLSRAADWERENLPSHRRKNKSV